MSTDGALSGRCDQPLKPQSHQTFHPVPATKLLMWGLCWENRCWPTTFHIYYSKRCRRMVPKVVSVISPSSPNHTKLSIRFQPWNCWCGDYVEKIDVGSPLFTFITVRDADGWCLKWSVWLAPQAPITPNFPSGSNHGIVDMGIMLRKIDVGPPLFTLL